MHGNNLINNKNNLKIVLYDKDYWDFYIKKDSNFCKNFNKENSDCLISYIDFTDKLSYYENKIVSKNEYQYDNAIINPNPLTLKNIGLCGVDNGIIRFRKDSITNEEFLKIFGESKLEINKPNLTLYEVSGNTMQYIYDTTFDGDNGIRLEGGFYQGFFETVCDEYQVLPDKIDNVWNFEFILMKDNDIKVKEKTLNAKHINNKGFFFYIGTRSENKWHILYNNIDICDDEIIKDEYLYEDTYKTNECEIIDNVSYNKKELYYPYVIDGYFTSIGNCDNIKKKLSFINDGYMDLENYPCCNDSDKHFCSENKIPNCEVTNVNKIGSCQNISDDCIGYLANVCSSSEVCCNIENNEICNDNNCCKIPLWFWRFDFYDSSILKKQKAADKKCCNNNIINGDWIKENAFDYCNEYAITDNYTKDDISIKDFIFKTDDGFTLKDEEYYIETDNKFLLFDRTVNGFQIPNWEEGSKAAYFFKKHKPQDNYFLIMNRTETGKTVNNIEAYEDKKHDNYDIKQDLYNNAFGLRITDDGKIGYRYITKNCETQNIEINEFYSKNIIKDKEWYKIRCKIKKIHNSMRIFIYVNDKLILCSKYLPLLNLRALNEEQSKQESVPYNISIGGGTQGLCDVILPNFWVIYDKILPLEENFGGTFLGYIKSFRFYTC